MKIKNFIQNNVSAFIAFGLMLFATSCFGAPLYLALWLASMVGCAIAVSCMKVETANTSIFILSLFAAFAFFSALSLQHF